MQFISSSEKQTYNFAKRYSKKLKSGKIIGLIGDLGTGKTIFTKGLATGLGIKKNITSPTFILSKIYPITNHDLIKYLVHIDAYRIKKLKEIISIGLEDYLNRPDTITIIEWADKIKKILPRKVRFIYFKNKGKNKRLIKC